jgi:histidyl-tRNA synthetase
VVFDEAMMPEYQKVAHELRENGIQTDVYYGAQKNLKKQLSYADKRNSPFAVIIGEDEIAKGVVTVKDLKLGKQQVDIQDREEWKAKVQAEIPRDQLVAYLKERL